MFQKLIVVFFFANLLNTMGKTTLETSVRCRFVSLVFAAADVLLQDSIVVCL